MLGIEELIEDYLANKLEIIMGQIKMITVMVILLVSVGTMFVQTTKILSTTQTSVHKILTNK